MTARLPTIPPYELTRQPEPGDIDILGHVNNVVYLRWVQDMAVAHWRAMAAPEHVAAIAWVALRHEIDYLAPALLSDAILLRTWVGEAQGLRFDRHTEVLRQHDGKVLARARTVWCPIDPATGRPVKVPKEVRERFSTVE